MIAAKVAVVDLVVELNLPLSTLDRINKVFENSLRIQTLLKGQLMMFLFLVLSSSFLCLLFFFSDISRHAYRPEKIGTVLKIRDKIKSVLPFCLILSRS